MISVAIVYPETQEMAVTQILDYLGEEDAELAAARRMMLTSNFDPDLKERIIDSLFCELKNIALLQANRLDRSGG